MTHVAKIPSETFAKTFYMTRVGPSSSCTCPSHFHRGGTCKHQKKLKAAVRDMSNGGITHLTGGDCAMGIVQSASGPGSYMTSIGVGGTCQCLAKYHNPRKQCKHQRALRASSKAVAASGIKHLGLV